MDSIREHILVKSTLNIIKILFSNVFGCKQHYNNDCVSTAGFRRPVVLFGPIADAANERLASEMPDLFVIASEFLSASVNILMWGSSFPFYYKCTDFSFFTLFL